jgi:hypothetical protein
VANSFYTTSKIYFPHCISSAAGNVYLSKRQALDITSRSQICYYRCSVDQSILLANPILVPTIFVSWKNESPSCL